MGRADSETGGRPGGCPPRGALSREDAMVELGPEQQTREKSYDLTNAAGNC